MEIGKVNDNSGKRYTMADLNITEDSPAASIFNRIDKSDGNADGYLTENQYEEYTAEIEKFKIGKSQKGTKEQTKTKNFCLGFLSFITHGFILPPEKYYNDDENVIKQSDPKLVELDNK